MFSCSHLAYSQEDMYWFGACGMADGSLWIYPEQDESFQNLEHSPGLGHSAFRCIDILLLWMIGSEAQAYAVEFGWFIDYIIHAYWICKTAWLPMRCLSRKESLNCFVSNPVVPLLCPVEQNNVFEDSRSLYQFTFEECEAQSCDFRNQVNWTNAVHLLLQLVPYVQLRGGTQKRWAHVYT